MSYVRSDDIIPYYDAVFERARKSHFQNLLINTLMILVEMGTALKLVFVMDFMGPELHREGFLIFIILCGLGFMNIGLMIKSTEEYRATARAHSKQRISTIVAMNERSA